MTTDDIKPFLLVYDVPNESLEVTELGSDAAAALDAYEALKRCTGTTTTSMSY